MENITKFFHNILPGSYFLFFFLQVTKAEKITILSDILDNPVFGYLFSQKESAVAFILFFVIIALLLGFIFQAITRVLFKDRYLYSQSLLIWITYRDKPSYNLAKAILLERQMCGRKEDLRNEFYIMNNFLNANSKNMLIDNFSVGSALWGNLAVASFSLILITNLLVKNSINSDSYLFLFGILFLFGSIMFWIHMNTFNSIILKSFVSEIRINHPQIKVDKKILKQVQDDNG